MSSVSSKSSQSSIRSLFRRKKTKETRVSRPVLARAHVSHSNWDHHSPGLAIHQEHGDGAWWCHKCCHQNHITIREDSHPFGQLSCGRCDHVICSSCTSTNVVLAVPPCMSKLGFVRVPKFNTAEIPYGQICTNCGMTHRAREDKRPVIKPGLFRTSNPSILYRTEELPADSPWHQVSFHDQKCDCGETSHPGCVRFQIGSNKDWREDHLQCYQRALDNRLEDSVRQFQTGTYSSDLPRYTSRRVATEPLRQRTTPQDPPPAYSQFDPRLQQRIDSDAHVRFHRAQTEMALVGNNRPVLSRLEQLRRGGT